MVPAPREFEELSADVELQFGGGVADPHGSCASVTFQVVQDLFRRASLAANAVHDLELAGGAGRAAIYKAPEPVGLCVEAGLG